ncbi:histone-lysine N-methyltransferase SETMAR-like [Panonychus citri]|uniref:histone-lysine N-methyltransferase SETMAR-like n=1 Tax=Panonychus citri TaxID=50023 RepID=UPI00230712D5|nr:histone-lysine N-methyltransferase SETMAR-like [Panonychus citri]
MAPDRNQSRSWLLSGEEPEIQVSQNIHAAPPAKTTVTAEVYKQFLDEYIPKWLDGKPFERPILLHDNARPHKATLVTDFLAEKQVPCWFHPPYSPDISPLDFCCFGQLKRRLKGINHQNWDEFEQALETAANDLNSEGHMTGVQQLPDRWSRMINSKGQYL